MLALHVRLAGIDVPGAEQRECLALVGLADRAGDRVGGFSKGMQQRLGLAVALVARPELVVLDEPTSALDPLGRVDVRDLVLALKARGVARAAQLAPHRRGGAGLRPGGDPRPGPGRGVRHPRRAARPARGAAAAGRRRRRRARPGWPAAGSSTRSGDWFTVALPADDDGATVPDLVRDLVGLGVRVHAVEPVRISLEERLLGILRHEDDARGGRRR